jgi:ATP-dependent Lhr-like helicase
VAKGTVRRVVNLVEEQFASGAPFPEADRLVFEGFDHFLVVHSPFGEIVNETFGDLMEELLARKGMVRFYWTDAYRILIELTVPVADLDLDALARELCVHTEEQVEDLLKVFLDDHYPLGYKMKGVAERFGAIPRGLFIPADDLNSFEVRFANTPVEAEAMREVLLCHVDFGHVREVFGGVRSGALELATWKSDKPSPLAYHIVRRFIEMPELLSPEGDQAQASERMAASLQTERVTLLCFSCQALQQGVRIGELPDKPACQQCGERILGVLSWHGTPIQAALMKHAAGQDLPEDQEKEMVRARQGGDLVAVHGKRAVIALSVYGVGPQAAARILAKMHRDEKQFYRDLYAAKLKYVTTKPFWDRGSGLRAREPVGKPYAYAQREGPSTERRL